MSATNSLNIDTTGIVTFDSSTGVFSSLPDPSTTYVVSSPYVVLATDDILLMDTTAFASPMSVVLLAAPTQDGQVWTIKDYSGGSATFNITISVAGAPTIDQGISFVLNENYQSVSICWDQAEAAYSIVSEYATASAGSITLDGDTGSATGSTINVLTGVATINSGSSIEFTGSGSTLTLNVTDASQNTIIGNSAGNKTLTGAGCTSLGYNTLDALTSGSNCVAVGVNALSLTQADSDNVAVGANALQNMNGAGECVAIGSGALNASTADALNNAIGYHALNILNGGIQNCSFGGSSGASLVSGSQNLMLGHNSGTSYISAESGNILLNSSGVLGESHTLRIGAATGTSGRDISTAFIFGINGNTVANTQMVTINSSTSQLGTQAVPTGVIATINGDSGSMTGSTVTISGGSTGLTTAASSSSMNLTGTLVVANGGTGHATLVAYELLAGGTTTTGALQQIGLGTAGQVLTSNGSAALATYQAPPVGLPWVDVTSGTQTIAVNTGYVTDNATTVTYTLPASPAFGSIFEITGGVSGSATIPWSIHQPAGQSIHFGASTTTVGVTGSLSSTLQFDSVRAVCIVAGASAVWNVLSSLGNLTVV